MRDKKFNVIWILVDSVRSYRSGKDDRDRLDMMDEFGKTSVEFKNVITSAPSTFMALSAMMTSQPAYYISRNFDDFIFDNKFFLSLDTILKNRGYSSYAIFRHPESRDAFKELFDIIDRKYWAKGLKQRIWWSNKDVNRVLTKLFKNKIKMPAFIFLHYNCRLDPKTSDIVKEAIRLLNRNSFKENNTIFILCSDHGYPDPSKKFSPEEFRRRNLGHDLHLTDDNIMIPLFIKYPGCPKGKKIKSTVSSLDITPTILDILNFRINKSTTDNFKGKSLLGLIEGREFDKEKKVKVRSDIRFLAQKGRATAIRGNRYKYVYHHDTKKEEFYDIKNDRWEENNIISSEDGQTKKKIDEFRREFKHQEKEAVQFQFNYILSRFQKKVKKYFPSMKNIRTLILGSCALEYIKLLLQSVNKTFDKPKIDILIEANKAKGLVGTHSNVICYRSDKEITNIKKFKENYEAIANTKYHLIILPYDNKHTLDYKIMLKLARKLKKNKLIAIDYNMNFFRRKGIWYRYLKIIYDKRKEYLWEPSLFFVDFYTYGKALYKRINKRLGLIHEHWDFSKK